MTSATTMAPDLEQIAAWAATFEFTDLPPQLIPTIRACVLYGLAVGVATVKVPAVRQICDTIDLDRHGSAGSAVRLLDGNPASVTDAALANGVLLSGRVQGDSHPCGHIGGVVIPTAIAVAQHQDLSGADFLASLVVGYETGLRIGRDHAPALSERGFRTTPCYGVFSAAAATSRGLRLDASATRNALSTAANLASGLREYVNAGTDESPLQAGFAARSGITAALLASTGLRSASTALHGPAGFYSAYGGDGSDHGARLCEDLGTHFEFATVTYKPYPSCQFLRGMIKGLADLRNEAGGSAAASIEVTLCPFEADFIGVRYAGPFTASSQTVMSAPFCAALAWLTGTTSYGGLRDFTNPDVIALIPNVIVVGDPSLDRYQTRLRVTLADGYELTTQREDGAASYNLTWEAAVPAAKALCAEAGAPERLTDDLITAARGIDEAPSLARLVQATRALTAKVTGATER